MRAGPGAIQDGDAVTLTEIAAARMSAETIAVPARDQRELAQLSVQPECMIAAHETRSTAFPALHTLLTIAIVALSVAIAIYAAEAEIDWLRLCAIGQIAASVLSWTVAIAGRR